MFGGEVAGRATGFGPSQAAWERARNKGVSSAEGGHVRFRLWLAGLRIRTPPPGPSQGQSQFLWSLTLLEALSKTKYRMRYRVLQGACAIKGL